LKGSAGVVKERKGLKKKNPRKEEGRKGRLLEGIRREGPLSAEKNGKDFVRKN